MTSPLADLPSKGLCVKAGQGRKSRTGHAPTYFPTHDTAPPPDQIITTDKSNQLLVRFRALLKEKDGRRDKRQSSDLGGANAHKKPKI
mmetsp:Transcript_27144/g.64102  ORF Transcript_27144/g.64102 Transcript_27144/m.64102 type:complete len:88 (-) Transcript_27144:528-791(-)|eukprot:1590015-Rhodomonas_salina.1